MCYFHTFTENGIARIYNPDIKKGIAISFDSKLLPYFTQWKMMGKYDYVLGLEPGNCLPIGRKEAFQNESIVMLKEMEQVNYEITIKMMEESNYVSYNE